MSGKVRFESVDTPTEYRNTYLVNLFTEDDKDDIESDMTVVDVPTYLHRTVIMVFDNADHAEAASVDHYDKCRVAVDAWLFRNFGEHLANDGEDIECSGYAPDNDDVVDVRTTVTPTTIATATTSYPIDC